MNSQEERLNAKEVFLVYLSMTGLSATFLALFIFLI